MQHAEVLLTEDGAGDAADVGVHVLDDRFGKRRVEHDVGDGHPPARLEDPRDLPEDDRLVGDEVDDAIARHRVHCGVGDRERLEVAFAELDVREPGPRRVRPRLDEHRRRHVHADDPAGGSDGARREEGVDPRSRTEVDHRLAGLEREVRDRRSASEPQIRFVGEDGEIRRVITHPDGELLAPGPATAGAELLPLGDGAVTLLDDVDDGAWFDVAHFVLLEAAVATRGMPLIK